MAARTTSDESGGVDGSANRAVGNEYVYQDGDSENDYIRRNGFGKETGYGLTNFLNPVMGFVNAFRGRSAFGHARAAYERQLAAIAQQKRAKDYYGKMFQLDRVQAGEDANRDSALAAVDNPDMIANDNAEVERGYNADIGNAYAGLSEQYGRTSQRQGLAAARRGVQGGSNDVEQQSDLGAGFQSKLMDASQAALGRASNDYRARADSRSSLRRSILTGSPQEAAAWTERSRGEEAQNERESRMMDYMNAFQQIHQQQAEDNSRLIGGAAGAIGDSYRVDQSAKADGGVGLY